MNELVVHIGMPKTGTSSLQRFLAENQTNLAKYGWYYPDARGNFNDSFVDADGRWANGGLYPFVNGLCDGNKDWLGAFSKFLEVVDKTLDKGNVILSEESLWFDEEGIDFLSFLRERYGKFKVITYLRRQDNEMVSLYAQLIRNINMLHGLNCKECISSIKSFSEDVIRGQSDCAHVFDYNQKLMAIEDLVGIDNISVFLYEDVIHKLKEHFLEWLGMDYKEFYFIDDVNVTSDVVDTEVKRRLNETFIFLPEAIRRNIDADYRCIKTHEVELGNVYKRR